MYANSALKGMLTCLGGCIGFVEVMMKADFHNKSKAKRNIIAIGNNAKKAMDIMMEGLDPDQITGIAKQANNSLLQVVPRHGAHANDDWLVVYKKDLMFLLHDVLGECTFCEKDEKGQRRCKKRKALLNCQMVGSDRNKDGCPMQGVMVE